MRDNPYGSIDKDWGLVYFIYETIAFLSKVCYTKNVNLFKYEGNEHTNGIRRYNV